MMKTVETCLTDLIERRNFRTGKFDQLIDRQSEVAKQLKATLTQEQQELLSELLNISYEQGIELQESYFKQGYEYGLGNIKPMPILD